MIVLTDNAAPGWTLCEVCWGHVAFDDLKHVLVGETVRGVAFMACSSCRRELGFKLCPDLEPRPPRKERNDKGVKRGRQGAKAGRAQ